MKPIIFSTPMVQAILEGRKTQTRRIVKPQTKSIFPDKKDRMPKAFWTGMEWVKPPYQPGDILWVRETWCKNENPNSPNYGGYEYYADYEGAHCQSLIKWRSPCFMPKEAARIFLLVKEVRAERLQEITVDDCRLEGCCCSDCLQTGPHSPDCKCDTLFYNVWNDINAKRGYSWDTNPWVWVYEFERISKEEAERLEGLKGGIV